MKAEKVIVAMSGGVDSSVSAALLKKAGFNVTGMYMKCWSADDPFGENCSSTDDERMARLAAAKIGIPFYSINLIKEYKERVVQYLLNGYKKGITPNPDVMCNKEIKFGLFFEKAMELGADYIATGHYARISTGTQSSRSCKIGTSASASSARIFMGKDKNKDQSYFLSFIRPKILDKILFPIGEYTKPEVRNLAIKFDLPNAERKDSQGICFIGKVDFVDFLTQYISPKKGNIVDTKGNILGTHEGAFCYTLGQRKRLGLGGGPYFVVDTDIKKNIVVVSKNENDLLGKEVHIKDLNWFAKPAQKVLARIRYRQAPAAAIFKVDNSKRTGRLVFNKPQRAITSGQLAVLYQDEEMIGGGVIA